MPAKWKTTNPDPSLNFLCVCLLFCECQNDELEWELEKGFKMIQGDDGKGWLLKVFQEFFVNKWYFKFKLIDSYLHFVIPLQAA